MDAKNMTTAHGTFQYKTWNETAIREGETDLKMTRAEVTNTFLGDIQGETVLEYAMVYYVEDRGYFIGLEQVTGKVGERTGTFVLQQQGTFHQMEVTAEWFVVPGSGTGELAGLHGSGGFKAVHEVRQTPFTLDYYFE